MSKIKTLRKTSKNAMEHSRFINYTCHRRNGLSHKENGRKHCFSALKTQQAVVIPVASEDIECSIKLFPHFIHVCNLTTDFLDRAAKVIKIPHHRFSSEMMKVLCMGEETFKKTKNMLSVSNLDTLSIRSVITDPEVREIHEALTELLETPVWELLDEIKHNMQMSDASHQMDMISMELDVLLNTVKHVASNDMINDGAPERQDDLDIPVEVKDYLLSYGTLGGFVSDQNNDTLVLTCSHVCRKGDIIFADDNDHGRVRIGECVFSNDLQTTNINEFIDVALVKIDNDALKRCNLSMLNDTLQQSNVKIYLDNLQQIASKDYVYKIGASTSVTKGLITSPKVHLKITGGRAELFFVSDIDDPFAEKGDSGSIVFTIENSSALDTIYVIGMVSGVFTPHQPSGEDEKVDKNKKTDKKDDEGAKKEVSCTGDIACFRMDKTVEFLRKKGIDVSFKNQI
uniref:Uncharacterized protein n=1 Tax=Magallana gigas TaxID=29159 RepID=K1RCY9_MAGGI